AATSGLVNLTATTGDITLDNSQVYSYAYAEAYYDDDATTNTATAGNIILDAGASVSLINSQVYSEADACYGDTAEATSGLINITAGSGDITLDNSYVYSYAYAEADDYLEAIATSGNVTLTADGNIDLNSSQVYSYAEAYPYDTTTNTATSGNITLDAGGSISLADSDVYSYAYASDATTNTATAGNIILDAGGSISLINSQVYSDAEAYYGDTAEATSGLINITAGSGDITLDNSYVYSYAYAEDATTNTATSGNIIAAGQNFINNAGAGALSTSSGRWLVYSTDPANDTRGGLTYNFKQYNATYGVTDVQGTGNGFLYSVAPTITPGLTGTVTKTYDGDNTATLVSGNYSVSGEIDSDIVMLNNPASGTYDNKNVGAGKTVTVSGLSVSAADGAATVYGYSLSSDTASGAIGNITAKALTVTADNKSKIYGDANPALTASYSGLVSDDTSSVVSGLTLSTAATTGSNVGSYTITAADGTATNYTITFNNGVLTITASPATTSETVAYTDVYQEGLVNIINEMSGNPTNIAGRILTTSDFAGFFTTEALYENTFVIEDMPRSMEE
ncbi:MAG: hypothetical protein KJ739_03890, partial [Nitrospinae bacterium]|nr:hypothetical protein [Nitrospinota bacterium]